MAANSLKTAQDFTSMLRRLDREQIIEILSDSFCQHCHSEIQSRVEDAVNRKFGRISLSNSNSSEGFRAAAYSSVDHESRHKGQNGHISPPSASSKQLSYSAVDHKLSETQKEEDLIMFKQIGRKKDFSYHEKIDGRSVNVLKGLELHTRVFSPEEQKKIVEYVYELQQRGQKGQLRQRTYSEPRKWMRGKGRITMQFGCCYNYAEKDGNPPGILQAEEVDPLPSVFKQMIQRMVRWHVLPPTCVPNSCIVNIYEEGDCIPPHIDHHDFLRPFCTVSFLTECNILFGSRLKMLGPGEFAGPVSISLPVGSVLILSGNGADVAKHCVPSVPTKRISITFRRMDDRKLPHNFREDPDLRGLKPLILTPTAKFPVQQRNSYKNERIAPPKTTNTSSAYIVPEDEFPPLGLTIKTKNTLNQSSEKHPKITFNS